MKRFRTVTAVVLSALMLFAMAVPAFAADGAIEGGFRFLTYNVAGLGLTGANALAAKQGWIGEALKKDGADIVATQEDFAQTDMISYKWGVAYRTHAQSNPVTGDGLNIYSKTPIYNVAREGWNKKGGAIWEGDIVSQKGVMMAVVELQKGVYVDVYNLHADAFGGQESREARYDNFAQTVAFVKNHSKDHAVIITGDFNCAFHFGEPEGRDLYKNFIEELGMRDAWTDVVNGGSFTDYSAYKGSYWGNWDSVECVLYRSSDTLTLTPETHDYLWFKQESNEMDLSDHAAAAVNFRYTASAAAEETGLTPAGPETISFIKVLQIIFADLRYAFSHFDEVIAMIKYANNTEYLYEHYSR